MALSLLFKTSIIESSEGVPILKGYVHVFSEETLKIVPELTNVYLIKGSNLKIDCIYSRPSRQPSNPVDFYHGLTLIKDKQNGFGVMLYYAAVFVVPDKAEKY